MPRSATNLARGKRERADWLRVESRIGCLLRSAVLLAMFGCSACHDVQPARLGGEIIEGRGFRHRVLRNEAGTEPAASARAGEYPGALHVYIEGDGVPGSRSGQPSRDPTSRAALMPRLMRADPSASIYLGRPCYDGLTGDRGCNAHVWTDARFSAAVVASMGAAIESEMQRASRQGVVLIGYSGGGTLSVLLAQRMPTVVGVITLGGNLDTTAWTRLHGYAPLEASLNPAAWGRRLPDSVKVFHWVGADDRSIPPWLVKQAATKVGGEVIVIPGFRHDCCWETLWPRPLALLERSLGPAERVVGDRP